MTWYTVENKDGEVYDFSQDEDSAKEAADTGNRETGEKFKVVDEDTGQEVYRTS